MRNAARLAAGIILLVTSPAVAGGVATKSRSNIQNNRPASEAQPVGDPASEPSDGGRATRSRSNIQNNRSMPGSGEASGASQSGCTTDRGAVTACDHAIQTKGTGTSGRAAASGDQACVTSSADAEVARAAAQPGGAAPTCSDGSSAAPPK